MTLRLKALIKAFFVIVVVVPPASEPTARSFPTPVKRGHWDVKSDCCHYYYYYSWGDCCNYCYCS